MRARLNAGADAFRNEFKNCRIFLVKVRGEIPPALRGGIYAVRSGGNARTLAARARFCESVCTRKKKKKNREKGFWSRGEGAQEEGRKRKRESKERGAKVMRGKKAAREEFGEHYSPAVSPDRWTSEPLTLFLPRVPI